MLHRGRLVGNPHGHQGHGNGGGVGEHVTRIGDEGQAARQYATYHLGHHVGGNEAKGNYQAPPAGAPQVVGMVVVVMVVVAGVGIMVVASVGVMVVAGVGIVVMAGVGVMVVASVGVMVVASVGVMVVASVGVMVVESVGPALGVVVG